MDKYFEIKPDCALYKEYFAHEKAGEKIVAAFNQVREKFGIETTVFYLKKGRFHIAATDKDMEKFSGMMKKGNVGEFRKNSAPSKMWVELVKDIAHFERPQLLYYFSCLLGRRWKERLFHIGDKLYCSIESDGEVSVPEFAVEMKASEFYKIIEDAESEGET